MPDAGRLDRQGSPVRACLTHAEAVVARELVEAEFGPGYWDGFDAYMTSGGPLHEWRFGGQLGFGGKVRLGHFTPNGRKLYVDCYPEDATPELAERIREMNVTLAEVVA